MSSFKRRLMMAQQVGNVDYSLDGQYQTTSTLYGGYLYTSSDYGQTWEKHSLSSTVQSISISATGQYQTAVGSPNSSGYIYISSDYGKTWQKKESSRRWGSVSISATGQYQTAAEALGGYLYTSSDYGQTWKRKGSSLSWDSVSISATGQYQTALQLI